MSSNTGSPEIFDSGIVCNNGQQFLSHGMLPNDIHMTPNGDNTPVLSNPAFNNVIYQNIYQQMIASGLCNVIPNYSGQPQAENNNTNIMEPGLNSLQNNPFFQMPFLPPSNSLYQPNTMFNGAYGSPPNMMNVPQHMANCTCGVCLLNRNTAAAYLTLYQNQLLALNSWNTLQVDPNNNNNFSSPVPRQPPSTKTNIFSSSPKYQHENNKMAGAVTFSVQQECDTLQENLDLFCNVGNGIHESKSVSLTQTRKKPTGVSKNILYKTVQCNDFKTTGSCPRGNNCQFAHGNEEVHDPRNHSLYKTAFCNDFKEANFCPRGNNCFHVHDPSEMRQKANGRLSFSKRQYSESRKSISKTNFCAEKENPLSGRLSPSSVAQIINMQSHSKAMTNESVKKETEEIWNILNLSNNKKISTSLK